MRNRLRIPRLWILPLLLLTAPSLHAQAHPLADFETYVERALEEWGVPGVAVAVVKDDSLVYARGFGVREVDGTSRVDAETVFAIGSSSKAFTATALAMLVEEGKVGWDERATAHLPEFQLFDPYVTREITVRDLLSHRSGLARGEFMWYASGYSRDEILRRVRYQEPSTSFRSRFGYQNVMYLAAGQIVPAVAGTTWDRFIEERLFAPLGMRRSSTTVRALDDLPNVASPHVRVEDRVLAIQYRDIDNIAPAGSINASVVDMSAWVRLNLNRGEFGGVTLLQPATVAELHAPQTIMGGGGGGAGPESHFRMYGLGWMLQDYQGRKLVHHGGNIDGMTAMVAFVPEENVGLVVLSNMNGSPLPTALKYRILDAYLGAEPRDWSGEMKSRRDSLAALGAARAGGPEESRLSGTRPSLPLERYAGTYEDEMYGNVTIALEDDGLVLRRGEHYTGDLEHWHHDIFRATWRSPGMAAVIGQAFVSFRLDPRGRLSAVDVENMTTFGRAPDPAPAAAPEAGGGSR